MADTSRWSISICSGSNQPSSNVKMDAVIHSKYAAILAALAICIGLGGVHKEDKRGGQRPAQCTTAGMETAQASPTAARGAKAKVNSKTGGITNPTQESTPAAAVPATARARQANWHKTKATQVRHFSHTI
jgi:hypothetical protein